MYLNGMAMFPSEKKTCSLIAQPQVLPVSLVVHVEETLQIHPGSLHPIRVCNSYFKQCFKNYPKLQIVLWVGSNCPKAAYLKGKSW